MPLPPELQTHLDRLLGAPPSPPADLTRRVLTHLDAAESHAANSALVDAPLARRVATGLLTLLDHWTELPEPHQRLLQAACEYFVETTDDDHDFHSVIGFEDDAELLNHVASALGRDDLRVELE